MLGGSRCGHLEGPVEREQAVSAWLFCPGPEVITVCPKHHGAKLSPPCVNLGPMEFEGIMTDCCFQPLSLGEGQFAMQK